MKKKYTFEQVVRLLKKHAGDAVPYEFEHNENLKMKQKIIGYIGGLLDEFFIVFYRYDGVKYVEDCRPYCRDGWELARPVKVNRERILIGTVPRASVIGLSGMLDELVLTDIQDGDYDLYAVKR